MYGGPFSVDLMATEAGLFVCGSDNVKWRQTCGVLWGQRGQNILGAYSIEDAKIPVNSTSRAASIGKL